MPLCQELFDGEARGSTLRMRAILAHFRRGRRRLRRCPPERLDGHGWRRRSDPANTITQLVRELSSTFTTSNFHAMNS